MISGEILAEHDDARALALWKTARVVAVTAALREAQAEKETPDVLRNRAALIEEAFDDPAWREPLLRLARIGSSSLETESDWRAACLEVADVAERASAPMTALEFTQAAALIDEADAHAARIAGIRARRVGKLPAAELWFAHAISRGRQHNQKSEMVWGYVGLAIVQRLRGANPAARRTLLRGLKKATRFSLHELIGPLHHELVVLAARAGQRRALLTHAEAALQGYGPGHDRLVALAHDVATGWMQLGYFRDAFEIFRQTPEDYGSPTDQLARASNIARSAGAIGDRQEFTHAWNAAEKLAAQPGTAQVQATALLAMARGALSMQDMSGADSAARQALGMAQTRGESENIFDAESLIEEISATESRQSIVARPVRRSRKVANLTSEITQMLAATGA